MERASLFRRYLLPGFVFQSVVIAGGYGTGRELAEFFLVEGPVGGLLAIAVTTVVWSAVCMASFEFARLYRTFDYRSFFRQLLGPAWFLYEICYVLLLLIVLAVIAAAAGAILQETFGLPYGVGVGGMMAAVGLLVLGGSEWIERAMAGWSFVLYAVYVALFVWCFARFGPAITEGLAASEPGSGWIVAGVRYAAYNLGTIPAILFVVRHARTTKETLGAGLLAGPIGIIPGILFYLCMVSEYPAILERPVPANHLLEVLGSRGFQLLFQVVLFGTLIETGSGLIHAVNERVAHVYEERSRRMPPAFRPAVALVLLLLGTVLAQFGLIDLIARGYGTLTWAFLAVFVVPVLTLGVWRIVRTRRGAESPGGPAVR